MKLTSKHFDQLENWQLEMWEKPQDGFGRTLTPTESVSGYLYVDQNRCIELSLPVGLAEFATHGGENGGGHIRSPEKYETFEDAADAVTQLFEDATNLEKFIKDFGRNGVRLPEFDKKIMELKRQKADTNFRYIRENVDFAKLLAKYGREYLIQARKTMTVGQFMEL